MVHSGEHKLRIALLENAQSAYRRGNRKEAEQWVSSEDRSWPYAFVNVCGALGLDPESARECIMSLTPKWQPDAATNREYCHRWRRKNEKKRRDYMTEWRRKNAQV